MTWLQLLSVHFEPNTHQLGPTLPRPLLSSMSRSNPQLTPSINGNEQESRDDKIIANHMAICADTWAICNTHLHLNANSISPKLWTSSNTLVQIPFPTPPAAQAVLCQQSYRQSWTSWLLKYSHRPKRSELL